jgi:DNA-binding transcriptional LysR family regulator
MLEALWDGDLDCYIGRIDWDQVPPSLASVLRHQPLLQSELALACSKTHPLAGRRKLSVHDLVDWPWALQSRNANNRIALDAGMRDCGLAALTPAVEVAADPNALITMALHMDLLIVVARMALETHVSAGELEILEVPDLKLPPIQVGFVTLTEYEEVDPLRNLCRALSEIVAG